MTEVDGCAKTVIDAASEIGAQVIVVSEYGLVPVQRAVAINRVLREAGWLIVRDGPFGEQLMPGESKAFAVVDHQLAHIYVRHAADRASVKSFGEGARLIKSLNLGNSSWIIRDRAS